MILFKDIGLDDRLQKALGELGFTTPTEIQQRVLAILLSPESIDMHGQAQTGTGKTLAFGIPLIQKIDVQKKTVQGLVVAPTRELVVQITRSLREVAAHMPITIEAMYGGVSMEQQIMAARRGTQIVVGTPGRLIDHLRRKTLSFKDVRTLVLDEADIMLDMGFKEDMDEILRHIPTTRQIWLFSATVKSGINDIIRTHMKDVINIRVGKTNAAATTVEQFFCVVPSKNRVDAICRFVDSAPHFYGLIFCPTKVLTSEVAQRLVSRGYKADALHGDLNQATRNRIIKRFREHGFSILVATDVAARGIDISDVTHVINYSLPEDTESYVHRIGRTGRAGKEGMAITFITSGEMRRIKLIERHYNVVVRPIDVPGAQEIAQHKNQQALAYVEGIVDNPVSYAYSEHVYTKLCGYTVEQLANTAFVLLREKFLIPAKEDSAVPFTPAMNVSLHDEVVELFINLGFQDELDKQEIVTYLLATGKIKKDQIKRIKVLGKHTFIVVPGDVVQPLVDAVCLTPYKGKRVRMSMTDQAVPERRGSRSRRR